MRHDPRLRTRASAPKRKSRRPVVSVCIVNWNCRRLLRRCLRSLAPKKQGLRLEVIVVDNGSTDGAPEMVARRFPKVKLVRNARNESFSKANNQAASLARGKFLFFLNNDTVVPRGALRELLDFAWANPEVGLVGPRLVEPNGDTQTSWRERPTVGALLHRTWLLRWTGLFRKAYKTYRGRTRRKDTPQSVPVLMGAALLIRRKLFRSLDGWDEAFQFGGEDIDLCTRVSQSHEVVYYPETSVVHHGRVSSRARIGYAHTQTVLGITRYLRKSGTTRLALLGYKLALTLDAPLQWTTHALQWLWRISCGRSGPARKSFTALRGISHFLVRGLPSFWRI